MPSGGLPGYVPGMGAEVLPTDASAVLPKDIDLVFGMHYHPDGREEMDQTSVGLYFTDKPPVKIGSLISMGVLNIDIAPGEKDHLEETTYTLPVDVEVESIYEHMHLIGKTCKLWAELPDHSTKPIIKINDWDFNWQSTYHVKERYRLPKGTILHGEWTHDNSADNPANPNHPPKRVTNGEDYVNEMAGVLINVYVNSDLDNGVLWIANLGHLGAASVRPPPTTAKSAPHWARLCWKRVLTAWPGCSWREPRVRARCWQRASPRWDFCCCFPACWHRFSPQRQSAEPMRLPPKPGVVSGAGY